VPQDSPAQHLSRISTRWSILCQAHSEQTPLRQAAQNALLERYGGAVLRYLRRVVRDADVADELFQEFSLRFLHGNLKGFRPERGRFRDFIKGVLFHLVADHQKRRRKEPAKLPVNYAGPAVEDPVSLQQDEAFLASWRSDLLARAWEALATHQEHSGQPFYTVLRCRVDQPQCPSHALAEQLSAKLGKCLTGPGVRQLLHRARARFADLLLAEVIQSLENPNDRQLEQELVDLRLLDYCLPALKRRAQEK
jgi:RNA polymerase sigma-70 factor (ECF subfamily)